MTAGWRAPSDDVAHPANDFPGLVQHGLQERGPAQPDSQGRERGES